MPCANGETEAEPSSLEEKGTCIPSQSHSQLSASAAMAGGWGAERM